MENNLNSLSNVISRDYNESEKDVSAFQQFVQVFKNSTIPVEHSWNKERERYRRDSLNKRKIVMKEISQLDCQVIKY
jgi:hypothetical protein